MKKSYKSISCYFVALVLFVSVSSCAVTPAADVAARVNGRDISAQELDAFIRTVYLCMPDLQDIYSEGEQAELLELEILWMLIEYRVLQQELERLSLEPDEEELELNFLQLREDLISFIYGTEDKYLDRLQELQLDEEELKTFSSSTVMRDLLFQHVCAGVTEGDARAYVQDNPFLLEQPASVYAYRILLASEEEAMEVHSLLEQGADFLETGKEYSLEGFVELGEVKETDIFDPLFIEAAFQLEPGELSWPVETPLGFYIILITDKKEAAMLDFEEVKDDVMSVVQEDHYEKYIYRLLQESKIETF